MGLIAGTRKMAEGALVMLDLERLALLCPNLQPHLHRLPDSLYKGILRNTRAFQRG